MDNGWQWADHFVASLKKSSLTHACITYDQNTYQKMFSLSFTDLPSKTEEGHWQFQCTAVSNGQIRHNEGLQLI